MAIRIGYFCLSVAFGLMIACPRGIGGEIRSEGTLKMAERLAKLRDGGDPLKNPFLNRAGANLFGRQLAALLRRERRSVSQGVALYYKYAYQLLHAGENRASLRQFENLEQLVSQRQVRLSEEQIDTIKMNTILAHLRLGEQENCLERHTTDSCLVPIAAGGFHSKPEGSREAARLLTEYLETRPGNLRAAWLLNIAYMTLGQHPEAVPERYRIPTSVFDSDYPLPRFNDVAGGLGLDWDSLAGSVVMDDFDGDYDLDLMVSGMGMNEQLRLYLNLGDGRFKEMIDEAGLKGLLGGLNMVQADYDNDGDLDILVLRGAWFEAEGQHPNSLLRNRGNAVFDDVTEAAGLMSYHPTQAATWLDYDGDGWIDLFIGNETSAGADNPCELFRNQGDGTFSEVAQEVGITGKGMIKAVSSGDYNNDGRPDLYLSCRGQKNILYRNDGPTGPDGMWRFSNQTSEFNVGGPEHSFPSWFFDYDNDGWLDIFSCGYGISDVGTVAADYLGLRHGGALMKLYHNRGDGSFEDVTDETGLNRLVLGMAGNYGDLDNDGYPDFYIGTGTPQLDVLVPNRMFRNKAGQRFQDVTTAGGFGHIQKGHGIAFGDLDHDGDQDIYASVGGAYEGDGYFNTLFENPGNDGDWVKLLLEGKKANRAAIGAQLKVSIRSALGTRVVYQVVSSGGSFGASPLRAEVGLGSEVETMDLEIRWPGSGTVQKLSNLLPGRFYRVKESESQVEELALKRFSLKGHSQHQHPQ